MVAVAVPTPVAATVAALMMLNPDPLPVPRCERLALTTRQVQWEGREHVDEYYRHLRAAETRFAEPRWANVYASLPANTRELSTYVSLTACPCAPAALVKIDADAGADALLERAFGPSEADRLSEELDSATVAVSVEIFRPPTGGTRTPWRELGAPFIALTRSDGVDAGRDGTAVRLVPVPDSTKHDLWLRPLAEPLVEAAPGSKGVETQILQFRPDLSSLR